MARIRRYCGSYLLEVSDGKIKEYCGSYLYQIDGYRVKQYCGPYLYEIDGFISHNELMAVIAILFA